MKYEEIMKLLDAGYTKEEIIAMNDPQPAEPQDPQPAEPQDPQPAEPQDPQIDISSAVNELKEVFSDFKKELTAMNIMNSRIENPVESGEDVIAKIINPFTREKE